MSYESAKQEFNILDESFRASLLSNLRIAAIIRAERGEIGKAVLVGNEEAVEKYLGKNMNDINDLFILKRALKRGAQIYVTRAGHYTDPADSSTLEFTKSYTTLQDRGSAFAYKVIGATNKAKYTSKIAGTAGNSITITQDGSGNNQSLAISVTDYDILITLETNGEGIVQTTVAEMVAAVNANVLASALVVAEVNANGTGLAEDVAETALSGGAAGTNTAKISAKSEGAWSAAGKLQFLITTSSANSDLFNLAISYPRQSGLAKTYKDLSMDPEHSRYAPVVLASSDLITFEDLAVGTGSSDWGNRCPRNSSAGQYESFANDGVSNDSDIVDADVIGDSAAKTGLHVFDSIDDIYAMAAPANTSHDVFVAGAEYAENTQNFIFLQAIPESLDAATAKEWAEREDSYTGTPVYSKWASLVFGGLYVQHPTKGKTLIPSAADALGVYAYAHTQNPFRAKAGRELGFVPGVLEIYDNIGSAGRETDADLLAENNINPIAQFSGELPCLWDQQTRQREESKLRDLHAMFIVLAIKKSMQRINRIGLFQPHLPKYWRAFYRRVKPVFDDIAAKEGLEGGEGVGYAIQCDQNASTVADAILNTPDKRNEGEFIFKFWIIPTGAIRKISVTAIITQSGVNLAEISQEAI